MKTATVLQINSSGRYQESITRKISDLLIKQIRERDPQSKTISRDLATGLPFVDEQWIAANFTPAEQRDTHHRDKLSFSDQLVAELQQADTIVIGSPIYNFGVPAVLKAWIDLVARARLTFKYTDNGPVGLLQNKKAYLIVASGGVNVGSEIDFASRYLLQVLSFIGIDNVTLIDAATIDLTEQTEQTDLLNGSIQSQIHPPAMA